MTDDDQPPAEAVLNRSQRVFRPARVASSLSSDEAAREGYIIRVAMNHLGATAARAFLNTPDPQLGGCPLQIATASREGADAAEQAMLRVAR